MEGGKPNPYFDEIRVPGGKAPLPAWDLLRRTVFYKVGHHCSHNATLKKGGLDLMNRDDLVAFIPLDQETARNQGTRGWEMPAPALFKALKSRTNERVVISDVREERTAKAQAAGILSTQTYVDYFLVRTHGVTTTVPTRSNRDPNPRLNYPGYISQS